MLLDDGSSFVVTRATGYPPGSGVGARGGSRGRIRTDAVLQDGAQQEDQRLQNQQVARIFTFDGWKHSDSSWTSGGNGKSKYEKG
jgi:hypothetical protein